MMKGVLQDLKPGHRLRDPDSNKVIDHQLSPPKAKSDTPSTPALINPPQTPQQGMWRLCALLTGNKGYFQVLVGHFPGIVVLIGRELLYQCFNNSRNPPNLDIR